MPRLLVRDVPGLGRIVKVVNVRMPDGRRKNYIAEGRDALKSIFQEIELERDIIRLRMEWGNGRNSH